MSPGLGSYPQEALGPSHEHFPSMQGVASFIPDAQSFCTRQFHNPGNFLMILASRKLETWAIREDTTFLSHCHISRACCGPAMAQRMSERRLNFRPQFRARALGGEPASLLDSSHFQDQKPKQLTIHLFAR